MDFVRNLVVVLVCSDVFGLVVVWFYIGFCLAVILVCSDVFDLAVVLTLLVT